jgi:hypothetical protein
MRRIEKLLAILLLSCFSSAKASDSLLSCLPKDVTTESLVSSAELKQKTLTVREALSGLEARCQGGKLVDKTGREVRFFHLIGCWGNPPANYQERLASQDREIQSLKKSYTVLEVSCAPTNPRSIQ